jgi:hypothetical protein
MASANSFRRKVIAACEEAGWRKDESQRHTKLFPPDGGRPLILSKGSRSSTSGRAIANIKADLKRRGVEIDK